MSSQTLYLHSRPRANLRPRPSRRHRAAPTLRLSLSSAAAHSLSPHRRKFHFVRQLRARLTRTTWFDTFLLLTALALLSGLGRTVCILLRPVAHSAEQWAYTTKHREPGPHHINHTVESPRYLSRDATAHTSIVGHPSGRKAKLESKRHSQPRLAKNSHPHQALRSPAHINKARSPEGLSEEQDLSHLQHPRWVKNAHLLKFVPLRFLATDVRLVVLENAIFCTVRNRFLFPAEAAARRRQHFPNFMRRHAIAQVVHWRPTGLKATPQQRVVHVNGTTVLWRGRAIDVRHSHLVRSLLPIRSMLDELRKTKWGKEVIVAAEAFRNGAKADKEVQKMHEYFFGDVPASNRIALRDYDSTLLHFERVVSLGSEFEARAVSGSSFDKLKSLIEAAETSHLREALVRSCTLQSANRRTIWVLDRQQAQSGYGSIANMAEVVTAVNHALLRAGLADSMELRIFQSPDVPCGRGTGREGCYGTECGTEHKGCDRANGVLKHVEAFNNMTLLVGVAGAALDDVAYMPCGAAVVEVVPYGVRVDEARKEMARTAGVRVYQMRNRRDRKLERGMHERFGDVAQTQRSCWMDEECRAARERVATKVDVHHLKMLLGAVLREWRKRCVK